MKLDNAGIIDIYETLKAIKDALDEPMHRLRAVAMRRHFADLAEPLIEIRNDVGNKKPTKFTEEREDMLRRLAKKDSEGRPLVAANQYVLEPASREQLEEEMDALRAKHKEALDAYDAEIKRVNALLAEEQEISLPMLKIKMSWFNRSVKFEWLETLVDLIEDDVGATAVADAAPAAVGAVGTKKAGSKKG